MLSWKWFIFQSRVSMEDMKKIQNFSSLSLKLGQLGRTNTVTCGINTAIVDYT